MEGPYADERFPADPYPGAVPPTSFVHVDRTGLPLVAGLVAGEPLDDWLAARGAAPSSARLAVLSYGSNRNPSKITWLREFLGLGPEPVVVLRVRTSGLAAVWAYGLRTRDGARPAVLAAVPGVVEEHAVWLATPEQVAVLNACEGASPDGDGRYRLARMRTGEVRTDDGTLLPDVHAYVGNAPARHPLLVDGAMVRCADVPQEVARTLVGEAHAPREQGRQAADDTEVWTAPGSGLRALSLTTTTATSEISDATAR
ncbi:MAG: gamma-glutamylcyclotransferase [Pseudonocardia sp.]|uniref:gamma-glutamylcyclotransferase n=1 Tax=unclassified Pseudonocardia TaxID=2619320 RepID=UPI001AD01D19|nr:MULTISPECIES: gamma-glutamylcyclotransferase [unclassified Pseudonocardia]MBN9112630.1 gamma-glutamylcyclotransferase [Pseudonocardia sp.]